MKLNITFFLLFFVQSLFTQIFADKEFYLTDSLILEDLSDYDRQLVDSLLTQYHNIDIDSLKIYTLNQIVNKCYSDEVMIVYNDIVHEKNSILFHKNKRLYKENLGEYYGNLGYIFDVKYNYDSALFYYQKSLVIRKELKSNDDIGTGYIQIGRVYRDNSHFKKALSSYKEAISYLEKTTNYTNLAIAYSYVADILKKEKKNNDALFFYKKAIFYYLKSEDIDYTRVGDIYKSNADFYVEQKNYDRAILICDTAIMYYEKTKKHREIGSTYNTYATIYRKLKNRVQEKTYLDKALKIAEKIKKDDLYGVVFLGISKYHLTSNNLIKAETFALKSLFYSKKTNEVEHLISDYTLLEKIYVKKKNYKKAYHYRINLQELLDNKQIEKEDAILKYKIEYDFEQEKKHSEFVHQKEIELAEAEKQKSFNAMLAFGFIALLVVLFSVYIYNQLKLIRKQKIKLEESKKNELAVSNLKALQSQMNPHFIFNALNSVQDLVLLKDIRNSNLYLGKFSDLIRKILLSSKEQFIPLEEEIEILSLYLDLEKLRFGDDFEVDLKCDISEDKQSELILPAMFIQPYIENAIKHGLFHKAGIKKLLVHFSLVNNTLKCIIEDNGIGQEKAEEFKIKRLHLHTGFSTEAINERIRLLNETLEEKISIETTDLYEGDRACGTKIVIVFPV